MALDGSISVGTTALAVRASPRSPQIHIGGKRPQLNHLRRKIRGTNNEKKRTPLLAQDTLAFASTGEAGLLNPNGTQESAVA